MTDISTLQALRRAVQRAEDRAGDDDDGPPHAAFSGSIKWSVFAMLGSEIDEAIRDLQQNPY